MSDPQAPAQASAGAEAPLLERYYKVVYRAINTTGMPEHDDYWTDDLLHEETLDAGIAKARELATDEYEAKVILCVDLLIVS